MSWWRPFRRYGGSLYRALSSSGHRSCWDCDHLRVAGQTARRCELHPRKHIYSPMPAEMEVKEEREMGYEGSVADRCGNFKVALEFSYLFVFNEEGV